MSERALELAEAPVRFLGIEKPNDRRWFDWSLTNICIKSHNSSASKVWFWDRTDALRVLKNRVFKDLSQSVAIVCETQAVYLVHLVELSKSWNPMVEAVNVLALWDSQVLFQAEPVKNSPIIWSTKTCNVQTVCIAPGSFYLQTNAESRQRKLSWQECHQFMNSLWKFRTRLRTKCSILSYFTHMSDYLMVQSFFCWFQFWTR